VEVAIANTRWKSPLLFTISVRPAYSSIEKHCELAVFLIVIGEGVVLHLKSLKQYSSLKEQDFWELKAPG